MDSNKPIKQSLLDIYHTAENFLADMPIAKAIGGVISNPTPQEVGAQVENIGKSISSSLGNMTKDPINAAINFTPTLALSSVNTNEFKSWFGKSKILNIKNEPMVVYHGTVGKFTEFKKTKMGLRDTGFRGKGFYFSPSPKYAENFAKNKYGVGEPTGSIIPVYLKVENPFYFDEVAPNSVIDYLNSKYKGKKGPLDYDDPMQDIFNFSHSDTNKIPYGITGHELRFIYSNAEDFTEALKANGFDGVVDATEIMVFEPNQIKSIYNQGTFNINSNDIMKSIIATAGIGGLESAEDYLDK